MQLRVTAVIDGLENTADLNPATSDLGAQAFAVVTAVSAAIDANPLLAARKASSDVQVLINTEWEVG